MSELTSLKILAGTGHVGMVGAKDKLTSLIAMQIINEINGNAPTITLGGHDNIGNGVENQARQATGGTIISH